MKFTPAIAVLLGALALGSSQANAARAGTPCTWRMYKAQTYMTFYGPAITPGFCAEHPMTAGSTRFYGTPPGVLRCLFKGPAGVMYIKIVSKEAGQGRLYCQMMVKHSQGLWIRVR